MTEEGNPVSKMQPKIATTLKNYSREDFFSDLNAGIIVAIIALPLSIALAIASNVSPEKGLHTAIVAGLLISLLGGSRVQIGGPTGAFMIIVYGIVAEFGISGLITATFLAGLIMIFMGIFGLGDIIKFIPYPITTGFTAGIAVTIFSSQIKDFLGLETGTVPADFTAKWKLYFSALDTFDLPTLLIGILTLSIIILTPLLGKKIPGTFIGLFVSSLVVYFGNLDVATIGTRFGTLSSSLPSFRLPAFSLDTVPGLIAPAFTIAVLGSIESLLSAVVADGMTGGKHRSNMELVAQGTANMASALFGGIPATGAVARTVANIKNGGKTPVAGIVHALTLLLIMLIFMPLAKHIPLCALAAVLIMVAYNMSEWRKFRALFKSPRSDIIVLLTTFFITVFVDLVRAIEIGMVLASFLFMKRMADISNVNVLEMDASEEDDFREFNFREESRKIETPEEIQIYEINGPFFFGAADNFIEATRQVRKKTRYLIIRMRNVPSMDATALHAFERIVDASVRGKKTVLVSGLNSQPEAVIRKAGVYEKVGEGNFFEKIEDAIAHAAAELGK